MAKQIKTREALEVSLWKKYDVEIKFRIKVVGGVPKDPDTITAWINAAVEDKSVAGRLIETTKKEMGVEENGATDTESVEKVEKTVWNGFKKDPEKGLYIEGRQIKAMFKECANIVKSKLDMTAFKARVAERVFVMEDRVFLGVDEPTGNFDEYIHAMTPSGPITALRRLDYVEGATIQFSIRALDEPMITKKDKDRIYPEAFLPLLLEYGQEIGLGAGRSQGYGQFDVVSFEGRE